MSFKLLENFSKNKYEYAGLHCAPSARFMPSLNPVETRGKVLLLAELLNMLLEFLGMSLNFQVLFLISLRCFRKHGGICDVRKLFGEAFNAEADEIFSPRKLSITG